MTREQMAELRKLTAREFFRKYGRMAAEGRITPEQYRFAERIWRSGEPVDKAH